MQRLPPTPILLVLALACAVLVGRAFFREGGVPEHAVENRPIEAPTEGYATSKTCQGCHPGAYAAWDVSFHRSMTRKANPKTVFAPFNRVLTYRGKTYGLSRDGNKLYVEMDDVDAPEGFEQRVQREIVMVTGSHHEQVYWHEGSRPDRALEVLPFAWLIEDQRFAPIADIFLQPMGKEGFRVGEWNINCSSCHATRPRPNVRGTARVADASGETTVVTAGGRVETEVAEFGIACEACHGPGEEHVAANSSPARRYRLHLSGDEDPTIVQPERLPRKKSSEVCGQCHSIAFYDLDALNQWITEGRKYIPGSDLHAVRTIVQTPQDKVMVEDAARDMPRFYENHFWSDGMPRVSGREYNSMIASQCYKQGELSCLDCHSMHQTDDDTRPLSEWRVDQLKPGMRGTTACEGCHAEIAADPTSHSHHAEGSTGNECQNCHMPYTTYGLLQALRSHDITSPSVRETLEVGRPNACNLCHLDRTLDWTGDALESWYDIEREPLDSDQSTVAASLLWLLTGDAGQRALAAWHMGWGPARETSGTEWMPPYLAHLLEDPYSAVRYVAQRSLRSLEGFEDLEYEYVGGKDHLREAHDEALARWRRHGQETARERGSATLIDSEGQLRRGAFDRLAGKRDDRWMNLLE